MLSRACSSQGQADDELARLVQRCSVVDMLCLAFNRSCKHSVIAMLRSRDMLHALVSPTQVCDLLIRLYREHSVHGGTSGGAGSGPLDRGPVLASALAHLAKGLSR